MNEKRKDKAVKRYYHFVMKQIKVAAAVIEKDGKILIAKRAYGTQKGRWEFPGGKLEEGERRIRHEDRCEGFSVHGEPPLRGL